jgi:hypothetical protein
MRSASLARAGQEYGLSFVLISVAPHYKVYDEDESLVGQVLINSKDVAFKGFSFEGDGTARWAGSASPRKAADAVASVASALAAGYSFASAIGEFGEGVFAQAKTRRNPRSTGYVAAKIRANTARRNGRDWRDGFLSEHNRDGLDWAEARNGDDLPDLSPLNKCELREDLLRAVVSPYDYIELKLKLEAKAEWLLGAHRVQVYDKWNDVLSVQMRRNGPWVEISLS